MRDFSNLIEEINSTKQELIEKINEIYLEINYIDFKLFIKQKFIDKLINSNNPEDFLIKFKSLYQEIVFIKEQELILIEYNLDLNELLSKNIKLLNKLENNLIYKGFNKQKQLEYNILKQTILKINSLISINEEIINSIQNMSKYSTLFIESLNKLTDLDKPLNITYKNFEKLITNTEDDSIIKNKDSDILKQILLNKKQLLKKLEHIKTVTQKN